METTIHLELELTIKFDAQKAERTTRHYPGCPAAVAVNDIEIESCPINEGLFDAIMNLHEDELEEACWEELKEV